MSFPLSNSWPANCCLVACVHARLLARLHAFGLAFLLTKQCTRLLNCRENFAHGVAELAKRQERSGRNDFEKYMEWEARNGPYDLFIDAANVAFYGQNFVGGGFNWRQVKRMVNKVDKAHPDKKLLVMVHKRRIMDPEANTPEVQAFLESLRRRKAFYYTPMGSNDDWYWMYAAVRAKHKGLLVSNDELRDHIWGMLRPKHFLKWKARHIAQYRFPKFDEVGEPSLIYPPAYTSCVQQLDSGAWMFPCWEPEPATAAQQADSAPESQGRVSWLCARPVPAALAP
ncbi:hypothetical protein DUNSADRAFT_6394 [Dunaliella salina]|uniref:PRORP domain-containing protein n=1 Tax=Dunaliella salina TaxID=3046 RepID=A0ABQ7H6Q8_DUNSA|nr:hypothetical protein DUNSADRAFT_6394 [Dunaliella salina]|eukprot:KAF5842544.1 hypothetical protein DUNSADRAFT_6394 [Dunaliella salina]